MKKEDGDKILKALEEFINVELLAGNTITKYNGNALASIVTQALNQVIISDIEKEKLWDAKSKEWLENKKNEEEENKKKKSEEDKKKRYEEFLKMKEEFEKPIQNKEVKKCETVKPEEFMDISKPIGSNLLDEKLRKK